jgi:hypothetical protein
MKKILDNILFIFPVMGYYALEALIVGLFITILWKFVLSNLWGHFGYLQIVVVYWIIKMLFFNVFNLVAGISTMPTNMQKEMENDANNSKYNETITP